MSRCPETLTIEVGIEARTPVCGVWLVVRSVRSPSMSRCPKP